MSFALGQGEFIDCNSYVNIISRSSKTILYTKLKNSENDEYLEGSLYLYSLDDKKSKQISNDDYLVDMLKVQYNNDKELYVADGSRIIRYNLTSNEETRIYEASNGKVIVDYFVRETDLFLSEIDLIKDKKYLLHKKLSTIHTDTIMVNDRDGNYIGIENALTADLNRVFYISKEVLYEYCLLDKKMSIIEDQVTEPIFSSLSKVYYWYDLGLVEYNYNNERKEFLDNCSEPNVLFVQNKLMIYQCGENIFKLNCLNSDQKLVQLEKNGQSILYDDNEVIIAKEGMNCLYVYRK